MEIITITGNIGKDSELKRTAKGDAFATFSVACQKKKDAPTTWYRVSLFGVRGEKLSQYLTKGTKVTVVGEFECREYEKDGVKRQSLDVRTYDVALQGGGAERGPSQPRERQSYGAQGSAPEDAHGRDFGGSDDDGGLPF